MASIGKRDMTVGPEWKHILLFSLPLMAGHILQQLYNTVDGIVVGNFVSQNALAAIGSAGTLAFIFLAFAIGFSNGAGIMVAQLFGAKLYDELKSAVSTALILLLSMGVCFSVLGFFGARLLLHGLMNVEDGDVLQYAVRYFAIYALGLVFQFTYNAVTAILRAVGDSQATLYFLLVSSVLNFVLDMVFVIVFHWGVAGAAAATVLSQVACAGISLVYMFRKYPVFRFRRGEFVFQRDKCGMCLRMGVPNTIQQSIVSFGNVFTQRLVNSFGAEAMAAYTVGVRMEGYLFVPALGLSVGMATFTAQNIGAGRIDRVKRGCRGGTVISLAIAFTLELLSYIFAPQISALFGVAGEALTLSVSYVRFLAFFFWMFALYILLSGLFQGSGDVIFAMAGSLVSLAVRVVMAYVMALGFGMGFASVWWAMPMGWLCCLAMALIRYFTGGWKEKGIVNHG